MFSIMSQIRAGTPRRLVTTVLVAMLLCICFAFSVEARGDKKLIPVADSGEGDNVGGIKFYEAPGLGGMRIDRPSIVGGVPIFVPVGNIPVPIVALHANSFHLHLVKRAERDKQ